MAGGGITTLPPQANSPQWTATDWQTSAAIVIFLITWALIAKRWEKLPIGRTAGALFGAVAMVQLGILTATQANSAIEASTLLLLLGLMIILAHLETKGLVTWLSTALLWGRPSPMALLFRVSLLSGVMAAFIMNDGAALFLSVVVVDVCQKTGLPLTPYMITMATSANIGSAATVLGNPKNMVIHAKAGLGFTNFLFRMGPPALLGLCLNTALSMLYWRKTIVHLPGSVSLASLSSSSRGADSDTDEDDNSSDREDKVGMQEGMKRLIRTGSLHQLFDEEGVVETRKSVPEDTALHGDLDPFPWQVNGLSSSPAKELYGTFANHASLAGIPVANVPSARTQEAIQASLPPLNLLSLFQLNEMVDRANAKRLRARRKQRTESGTESVGSVTGRSPSPYPTVAKHKLAQRKSPLIEFATSVNALVAAIIVGMYVLFLFNFDLGWTCLLAAILIIGVERLDPIHLFAEVNFPLLLYILALFVAIEGVNMTPVAGWFWSLVHPMVKTGSPLPLSLFGFSLLVVILCFVFTSIPCVLLVSPHLADLSGPLQNFGWLLLAWCVTLCGNLTIFGSVAGVIASEAAAAVQPISFMDWFKYAFPATLVVLAAGACLLAWESSNSAVQ